MPIYEYRCANCRRRVSVFVRSFSSDIDPECPRCGGRTLTRLVSRVSVVKSEESRLETLSDPTSLMGDLDENDPKSVARWMRRMSKESGEELGPEFDEAVGRIESGEDPDRVMGEMDGDGEGDAGEDGSDDLDL